MSGIFIDALIDSAKMLPWLFVIYVAIELMEYRYGGLVRAKIAHANWFGPLLGALFGLLPQCGFSVVGAALYCQGLVSIGTLMAIFLATSDEAIPIIISQPASMQALVPLLICKVVVALIAGYCIDILFGNKRFVKEPCGHDHCHGEQKGCCSHDVAGGLKKRDLIFHPLRHTVTVFIFVFITSLALGMIIDHIGEESIGQFLLKGSLIQPFVTALIGLIPNCAASVIITQTFIEGGIGFGAAIAGLCTSGGLGLLVLFRESRKFSDVLRVIGILYVVSVVTGIIIQITW